jgi:hypothetical protein
VTFLADSSLSLGTINALEVSLQHFFSTLLLLMTLEPCCADLTQNPTKHLYLLIPPKLLHRTSGHIWVSLVQYGIQSGLPGVKFRPLQLLILIWWAWPCWHKAYWISPQFFKQGPRWKTHFFRAMGSGWERRVEITVHTCQYLSLLTVPCRCSKQVLHFFLLFRWDSSSTFPSWSDFSPVTSPFIYLCSIYYMTRLLQKFLWAFLI